MNKPEKLILDYSKWRCGGYGETRVGGDGNTYLLDINGKMCCIGQWSSQLGAKESDLIDRGDPIELDADIPLFQNKENGTNSELANDCIIINDVIVTTPEEKIQQLTERLAQEGIQLEVINKP